MRNVLVQVKSNQDGSSKYKPTQGYQLKRHVSKLLLLVPAEDQETVEEEDDVQEEKVILKNDVKVKNSILEDDVEVMKSTVWNEDDVCDAMAPIVSSSFISPGGNVAARRRSVRFGHTNA